MGTPELGDAGGKGKRELLLLLLGYFLEAPGRLCLGSTC